MFAPLPSSWSPLLIKKIEVFLEELGISDETLVCTKEVEELYTQLKLEIVRYLCLEKLKESQQERNKQAEDFKEEIKQLTQIILESPAPV